jgi:hypothetical protein
MGEEVPRAFPEQLRVRKGSGAMMRFTWARSGGRRQGERKVKRNKRPKHGSH